MRRDDAATENSRLQCILFGSMLCYISSAPGFCRHWIVHGFTSPQTQYRLYGRRFLQLKRPNQQYQSTEGEFFAGNLALYAQASCRSTGTTDCRLDNTSPIRPTAGRLATALLSCTLEQLEQYLSTL